MTKIEGSGSISQRHGSADPDPDPPQNVMDPIFQSCWWIPERNVSSDLVIKKHILLSLAKHSTFAQHYLRIPYSLFIKASFPTHICHRPSADLLPSHILIVGCSLGSFVLFFSFGWRGWAGKVRVSSKQAKNILVMNQKESKLYVSVVFRFVNSFAISVVTISSYATVIRL